MTEDGIAYYLDESGNPYYLDEEGNPYYVDENGDAYYLDENGEAVYYVSGDSPSAEEESAETGSVAEEEGAEEEESPEAFETEEVGEEEAEEEPEEEAEAEELEPEDGELSGVSDEDAGVEEESGVEGEDVIAETAEEEAGEGADSDDLSDMDVSGGADEEDDSLESFGKLVAAPVFTSAGSVANRKKVTPVLYVDGEDALEKAGLNDIFFRPLMFNSVPIIFDRFADFRPSETPVSPPVPPDEVVLNLAADAEDPYFVG